jgi:hypothetical protein
VVGVKREEEVDVWTRPLLFPLGDGLGPIDMRGKAGILETFCVTCVNISYSAWNYV